MASDAERLYDQRRTRYTTAMDVGKPDRVPIRLALGDVAAAYAGCSLQDVYYDLDKSVAAAAKVARELDIDVSSAASSMWWAAHHDAVGARYLRFAGRDLDANTQFQYVEGEYMLPVGGRFYSSGGVPNYVLAYGTNAEVAETVKRLVDDYAADGGLAPLGLRGAAARGEPVDPGGETRDDGTGNDVALL